ncbi:MAG TPA: hypothetical protein VGK25_10775 [Ignavibacteria bacterium]|jgi:hypothetical protein
MQKNTKTLIIAGLIVGAVFGLAGSMVKEVNLQATLYEISSIGMIVAAALLGLTFFRKGNDFVAAGFLLLAIAEAVMSSGTALGPVGNQPSFAAGMALYVPALLLISVPKGFPIWARIAGILTVIPFAIAAAKIFWGEQVLSPSPLPGVGYSLLVITFICWIIALVKEKYE